MASNIITLERPPLIYAEEADYLSVNLHVFEVRFRKGTTGYDEIWKDGRQVVANVRWLLKDSADKQVGIPQSIEWEVIDAYTLRVKRFYTDYLGTDFTVVYDCRSDDRVKVTVEGVAGKSDTFNLVWSSSGIALPSVIHDEDLKRLSCFEEKIDRPDVAFDYEDVYKQLGDITTVEISGSAGAWKADFGFNIGSFSAGEQFRVDPTLISTSESDSATGFNHQRKLVRLSNGTLYAVYRKQLAGQYQIYVKKSTDNGASWTDETRISTYDGMADYFQGYPSIVVDSSNYLHVVWHGKATGYTTYYQIWYAKYTTSWAAPVRISTYDGMADYDQHSPSIAVDSSDYLQVVWHGKATGYTTYYQIWYAKYTASWATPVRISTYSGMESYHQSYPSIVVDSSNYLHVVWYGSATGYTIYYQIWYAKYTTSWAAPVRISTYDGMADYDQYEPSIAVDSSDYIHVVWDSLATGYTDYYQIWYAKYTTSWVTPVRISTYDGMDGYDQYEPSIAVDSNDYLHVVWHGKATGYTDYNKVWYAKYTASWVAPTCLQATGKNQWPNARWSWYPSSNIPTTRLDYIFIEGTASPFNIYFDYLTLPVGWTGKISGVTNPAKVMGVDVANIAKVKGVASA